MRHLYPIRLTPRWTDLKSRRIVYMVHTIDGMVLGAMFEETARMIYRNFPIEVIIC
jgi:hypothetical protein